MCPQIQAIPTPAMWANVTTPPGLIADDAGVLITDDSGGEIADD